MNTQKVILAGLLVATAMTSVAAADTTRHTRHVDLSDAGTTRRIRHVEFSIAGSAQAFVDDGGSVVLMNMPLRIGAFITRSLEIEAEGIATVAQGCYDTEVGYIASLNGSYNFPASDKLMPFVLVGYGFTNSMPLGNVLADKEYDNITLSVLNAGLGWKFLFTPRAALRVEYRMQRFHGTRTYSDWYFGHTYTYDVDFTLHSVLIGVSLFF
jgi:opacity protein-like surface antigen